MKRGMASLSGRWVVTLLSGMVFIGGLVSWAPPAIAETMKCRTAGWVKTGESAPVGDVEGHVIAVTVRVGMAFFDTGDVVNFSALSSSHIIPGKGSEAKGYALWTFLDGSTILTSFQQAYAPSADPNYDRDTTRGTGEILSGTGRFAGITGSVSFTSGKNLKPIKGEPGGRSTVEQTFTYTLPPK